MGTDTVEGEPPASLAQGTGRVLLSPKKTLWLYANLIPGLVALPFGLSPYTFGAGFGLAFLTLCVGHSVGLHRGVIHKTYRTSRVFRNAMSFLFILAGLGGPLSWIRVHYTRDYWQNRSDCPPYFDYDHSIFTDYHWNLHCRFEAKSDGEYGIPEEDLNDPFLLFLERTWFVWPILVYVAVALAWSPVAAAIVCGLRSAGGILGHWFVGYVSHKVGYVRYAIDEAVSEGRNVFFLGVISFGEGFHNNHHAYPRSARMGVRWYELDAGWATVRALELLGLVWDVSAWHRPGFQKKDAAEPVSVRFDFSGSSAGRKRDQPQDEEGAA